jgi:hypothetical protein
MSFRNSDKVWHFVISVALVFIAFLFLTYCVYRRRGSHSQNFFRRLVQASLFSMVVGFLKEGLDAVSNDWFWCVRETCNFNGWDVAIYCDGVVLGALIIICVKMCTLPRVDEDTQCEITVASSVDGDGDDDDEENANAIRNNPPPKHGFSNDEIPVEIVLSDESSNADASASTKKSTSTEDLTTTSDSSTGVESDSYALDDDEEQQMPPV